MRICEIEGCDNKHHAKGLCFQHYRAKYLIEYDKQYKQDNKIYIKKRNKQYGQDYRNVGKNKKINQNKQRKRARQYYYDHRETCLKRVKQYCIDHREKISKYTKQYYKTPQGNINRKTAAQRRRTKTATLTIKTIQRVYRYNIKKYGRLTCCLCFKPIIANNDSLEHLTPITRGGSNKYKNLGVSHLSCNCQKGTMTLNEWFEKQEKDMPHRGKV